MLLAMDLKIHSNIQCDVDITSSDQRIQSCKAVSCLTLAP